MDLKLKTTYYFLLVMVFIECFTKGTSEDCIDLYNADPVHPKHISAEFIRGKLCSKMKIDHLALYDNSDVDRGYKFHAIVVSDDFKGKNQEERLNMVKDIINEELKRICGFLPKTYTVDEWTRRSCHDAVRTK